MYSIGFEPRTWCASWMIAARYAVDVQDSQDEMIPICVWIYSLLSILDLFSNRTSDTCQIQSSRLDRILWSHRWWKVVPSQKFVNIIIRNSNRLQVYQVSQILLVSSSGSMGVSCLRSSLFDSESWWRRCAVTHIQMYYPCFPKNSENLRTSKKSSGLQTFQQIEFKILSIRIIRIIRKKSQNRLHRFFGQRINKYHIAGNTVINSCLKIRNHDDRDFSPKMTFIRKRILEGCVINPLGRTEPPTCLKQKRVSLERLGGWVLRSSVYTCTGLNLWHGVKFQRFLIGKSVFLNSKFQIREFHAHWMKWAEVLERYCGSPHQAMLLKQASDDRSFAHAAGEL